MNHINYAPGTLLVVRGGLGIPSIVRVEPDGTWMCVAGIFTGRSIRANKEVVHICEDGDVFVDRGLVVRDGELVSVNA